MIRDPSDGTVREKPAADARAAGSSMPASGLPTSSVNLKEADRLNRSRAWLKNYQSQKGQ